MSGANGSFARVSVHVGADWTARCATYQGHTPLLEIGAGETEVSFCLAGKDIRASTVEFAAELAREAGRFAARSSGCTRPSRRPGRTAQPPIRRPNPPLEMRRGGWSWNLRPPPISPRQA